MTLKGSHHGKFERPGHWGSRWAFGEPRPDELDPVLLLWKMQRRVRLERLPPGRVVVEFEFTGRRRTRLWMVLKREEASVCVKPPGFDTDLVVSADLGAFYCVWLGRRLKWSPMAEHVRAAVDADRASMAR